MAPVDIRPPGYFPQGTFSGTIPDASAIEKRRKLAEAMMEASMDASPVRSPWQALARVAQGAAGGLEDYQAGRMEQQRYKALGEAMRSGMTPDQLYGTGVEELMNYAKFQQVQEANRLDAERQAATLQFAANADRRAAEAANAPPKSVSPGEGVRNPQGGYDVPVPAAPRAPIISPLDRQTQIEQAKADADRAGRIEGAKAFLQKVGRVEAQIGQADEKGNFVSGNEDLFGPIQSNEYWRQGAALLGREAESQRTTLESDLSDLELDVARMKLKGTGPISNEERLIARRTLPQLSNQDARTAWNTLQQRKAEALDLINGADGGPKLNVPIQTPRGPQHSIQNAPPPQPNVNAGTVPQPRETFSRGVDSGNGPPIGFQKNGWEFQGGDPSDPQNWTRIQ